jgi:hypothetical protein
VLGCRARDDDDDDDYDDNMSAEHNVAASSTEKTFTDCNSPLLRQHTVNQSFFAFCRV